LNTTPQTLEQWLKHIERLHPAAIALGLDRVLEVRHRLSLTPTFPVITVGGTNGKGSTCAMLEAILAQAGYRVGCYTSPHLRRYNERVRIARAEVTDAALGRAFRAVEHARANVELTYFEFGTLAAMQLFVEEHVDIAILEVGLGGRLDAVNAFDADCAILTAIDIDHTEYLGRDRETIGEEKAGILRAGKPAVCSDPAPPASLIRRAADIGATLLCIGRDFGIRRQEKHWQYWGPRGTRNALPSPIMRGVGQFENAAAAIAAVECLRERAPVSINDLRQGLLHAEAPGRFQVIPGRPMVILDVAHNPHAARALSGNLQAMRSNGRCYAVFAMLVDKDIAGVAAAVAPTVSHWYVAGLEGPRGAGLAEMEQALARAGIVNRTPCENVGDAYARACGMATENDRILVFGSFYTVASVMVLLNHRGMAGVAG